MAMARTQKGKPPNHQTAKPARKSGPESETAARRRVSHLLARSVGSIEQGTALISNSSVYIGRCPRLARPVELARGRAPHHGSFGCVSTELRQAEPIRISSGLFSSGHFFSFSSVLVGAFGVLAVVSLCGCAQSLRDGTARITPCSTALPCRYSLFAACAATVCAALVLLGQATDGSWTARPFILAANRRRRTNRRVRPSPA